MSNAFRFHWKKPPREMALKIEKFGQDILIAVYAVAAQWGAAVQNAARSGARWEDRTGNARGGLFFAVDGFGMPTITGTVSADKSLKTDTATVSGSQHRLVVTLGHTVFYGKFLELNGRYAIIMSTIESHLSRLESMMKGILS